jgi:hypothetical protein
VVTPASPKSATVPQMIRTAGGCIIMNELSDVIGAAYRAAYRPGRTPEQIADAVLADPSVNAGLRNPGFLMRALYRRLLIKEHKRSVRASEPTMREAERGNAQGWSNSFRHTAHGELCTEESLKVLHEAEAQGYTLGVEKDKTFTVTRSGKGTSYLRSNSDIQRFGRVANILPRFSEESVAVARKNTARRRQALELEKSPRARPAEVTKKATQFTIDGIWSTYETMGRDDFCDVVIAALKAGNLSEEEASHAIYAREWVLSGGDQRLSFPDWLAAEGRERFALLDREWLTKGVDPRMSFNEWYMSRQSASTNQEQGRTPDGGSAKAEEGEDDKGLLETAASSQSTVQVSNESTVLAQLPEVEAALKRCIVDFQDGTKLHYILIFPIMHKIAVKLSVEDFGVEKTLKHYERLVASLTSDSTIREYRGRFEWPDVPPQEAPRVQELDDLLWKLARDLIGRGILKETIASALVNIAIMGTAALDPTDPIMAFVSRGFLITVLKELRAGLHTPPPEVRPEATEGTDEITTVIFNGLRDLAYTLKDRLGLEWQHLLPGMQRVCVISCIKYQGRDGALALFRDQVRQLSPVLDQCQKNPPQQLPLTPLHIKNRSIFNEAVQKLADTFIEDPDVHPVFVAKALSMLITKLASTHYDIIYLSGILSSSCTDIEQGKYDFVRKTH